MSSETPLNKAEFEKSISDSNNENNVEEKPKKKCCTISVPLRDKYPDKGPPKNPVY